MKQKVNKIGVGKKKYEVNDFIDKTFPEYILVFEPRYNWWDRVFNTKRFKQANVIIKNKFYEEIKIQFKDNLNNLFK